VSGAGDVNGDGFADLIVGSSIGNMAQVFSGVDGSVLYTFDGDSNFDWLGFAVSDAGDVNDDGVADLIIGVVLDDNNGTDSGSARVLSGSDGSVLYSFDGDSPSDFFGHSVSGLGDINGDGVDDFIVGASNGGANNGGYARVFVSVALLGLPPTLGDCNQDGEVTFADIPSFIAVLQAGSFLAEADCNEDGEVTFADIPAFIAILQMQ